jgi:hypothetical protein
VASHEESLCGEFDYVLAEARLRASARLFANCGTAIAPDTDMLQSGMIQRLRALWDDESGLLGSSDYILMATIVVIGAVCGLATMRDAVVQNLGDIAIALATVDQSYTVNYTLSSGTVVNFGFVDPAPGATLQDLPGEPPYNIDICDPPSGGEGN